MRVLVNALSVAPGGGATVARLLVRALALLNTGDEYLVLVKDRLLMSSGPWPSNVRFASAGWLAVNGVSRVVWEQLSLGRMVRDEDCDLILGLGGFGLVVDRHPQVVMAQNAFFYTTQPWTTRRFRLRSRIQRSLQFASIRAGAGVVCVSTYIHDLLLEHFPDLDSCARIIPHGTDMAVSSGDTPESVDSSPQRALSVLWVGAAQPHKNLADLLAASPRVERVTRRSVELRIAGVFSDADQLIVREQAAMLGLSGAPQFLGYLDREALRTEYLRTTAFVSTSRVESSEMGVLEAMALGAPVIASHLPVREPMVGCIRTYPVGDVEKLSDLLVEILLDPSEQERLRKLGIAFAEGKTWQVAAEAYRSLFCDVINATPSP